MIYTCGCVQPCVPLGSSDSTFEGYSHVENICKSCGDMTDSLCGVCHLETHMQLRRKPVSLITVFRLYKIIHAKQTCCTHMQGIEHSRGLR